MVRRAGLVNGLAVFVLAIVLIAAIGAIVASQADVGTIRTNLRSLGSPTWGSEWSDIGTLAGIASLAAMLIGALVGGVLGERWHSKLMRRAVSGKYRPDPGDRQPGDDERPLPPPPALPMSGMRTDRAAPIATGRGGGGASRVE
jgi:hypothetical protein